MTWIKTLWRELFIVHLLHALESIAIHGTHKNIHGALTTKSMADFSTHFMARNVAMQMWVGSIWSSSNLGAVREFRSLKTNKKNNTNKSRLIILALRTEQHKNQRKATCQERIQSQRQWTETQPCREVRGGHIKVFRLSDTGDEGCARRDGEETRSDQHRYMVRREEDSRRQEMDSRRS